MANLYQGAYRATLDDNSDIEALEKQHRRNEALAAQGEAPSGDDEHDEVMAQAPKNAEEETFKQRYGNLRRHQQKVENELKARIDDLQRQLESSTKKTVELPKSEDEIAAWMQEFPDVAKIVQSIAMRAVREKEQDYNKRFEEIEKLKQQTAVEKAYAYLLKAVPDFETIRDMEEFHDWAKGKSKGIRYALYEQNTDWETVRDAVNLFKLETGYGKKKKSEPKQDASAAEYTQRSSRPEVARGTNEGKKIWTEEEIGKLRPKEYEFYEAEIEQARLEGRIRSSARTAAAF